MSRPQNIDELLRGWPYQGDASNVRIVPGDDGRDLIQMRVDMGLLQMETTGRPDGVRPKGSDTFYDHLLGLALEGGSDDGPDAVGRPFVMDEGQCAQADREFVQFYHRRVCWLQLRRYREAVADADHTLSLMDFCKRHSPDSQWTMSHEQYRPYVLYHRTYGTAMAELEASGAEAAIHSLNQGLSRLRLLFDQYGATEHFEEDELVTQLVELRERLRKEFDVGRTLQEQLNDAIAAERYELAARLRDEIAQRDEPRH